MLQEKTVVNDCYILQSEIGEDAYTEHWLATAIFSAKRFVLRFLREGKDSAEFVARLHGDAMRSYRVRGPSIADFVELETFEGRFFISSEYNDEVSLLREIESGRQWSLSQIANAIIALADALESFHALEIAYGNLSAESVLIIERGEQTPIVKIRKPSFLPLLELTGSNSHDVCESFSYIPPEYKSNRVLRVEGDIFSLGMHLFRLFTGCLPYPDDAETVAKSGPSLRYAVVALFRCGIPEGLVSIVIRALMREPDSRQASCGEVIAQLRAVLSSLKKEMDESAEPAAKTVVPTFERVDYFASLTADQEEKKPLAGKSTPKTAPWYPDRQGGHARQAGDDYAILKEELQWTVEDYLAYGMKAVFGKDYEKKVVANTGFGQIDVTVEEPVVTRKESRLTDSPGTVQHKSEVTAPGKHDATAEKSVPVSPVQTVMDNKASMPVIEGRIDQVFVGNESASHATGSIAREWTRHRIRIFDIKEIVARAAKLAESGHGSFRFIEEPQEYFAPNGLFDLLAGLSGRYLYVNAGTFTRYGTADLRNFTEMTQKALSRAIQAESTGSKRYLARRAIAADPDGLYLDNRLYRALGIKAVVPNRHTDWLSPETHRAILAVIRAFSRKSRPLILVFRGGESVTRNLHDLLTVLAGSVDDAPIAVFVFFGRMRVESWHTLSRLTGTAKAPHE